MSRNSYKDLNVTTVYDSDCLRVLSTAGVVQYGLQEMEKVVGLAGAEGGGWLGAWED